MCRCAHDSQLCQSSRMSIMRDDWHFVSFFKWSLCLLLLLMFPSGFACGQEKINVDSVISRVYKYVERYGLRNEGFTSEVYAQHYLRTKRKGIIMRYLPGALHLEKGENEYFGESYSKYNFTPPVQVDKKDIAAFSTMPYVKDPRGKWLGSYSMSIYEPNLFTDRILSPFNYCNRRFYKYKYQYSYQSTGRLVAHIDIEPRIWNSQLVRGDADIDVYSGEVKLFSLQFFYGWARLRVTGEMGQVGKATLLPRKITLVSSLKMFGNSLEEQFDATAHYDFKAKPSVEKRKSIRDRSHFDVTSLCRLRIDTTSMRRDLAFFEENRPTYLMPFQRKIYEKAARREGAEMDSLTEDDISKARLEMAEDIILDSHTVEIGDQGKVRFPPLLTPSMVEWSKNDGFALRTRFSFDFRFRRNNHLQFRPRVGYNFKEDQVYWECPLVFKFHPKYDASFRIEASGGDHIYNSRQADEVRETFKGAQYDSIIKIFNGYNFHYYRDNRFLVGCEFQPVVGLKISGGLRFHQRRMINWNKLAGLTSMQRTLRGLAPRLRLEWTPALYYYREGKRPVPVRTKWPTFMMDYERSISAIDKKTRYERMEFDASYRLQLHALRSMYFRLGGGLYTKRAEDCFLDYDNFRYNAMPTSTLGAFSGQFQLLNSHWYNESDYYLRLSAAYDSPMMLFSRIRYFTRIVDKEYLYCNILNVRSLDLYTEFGYGISLPLLRLAAFGAIAGKGQSAFGCKIALQLGEFY